MKSKVFWNWVRDETEPESRTLYLNGVIAEESWFSDEVTPAAFKADLTSGSGPITVWINSVGGDCVAAAQIYNMLMEYPHDVTVKIDGIAASAASVIAMAGTRVLMSPTSLLMIHNPLTVAMGDSEEMRKAIQLLDEVKESIINAYAIKTGLSRTKLSNLMDSETWMNAMPATLPIATKRSALSMNDNVLAYCSAMAQARRMLFLRLITKEEYGKIDTMMLHKYGLSLGSLFRDMTLITG